MFLLQAFSSTRYFLVTAAGIFFVQDALADTAGRVNFVVGEVTATSPENKQRLLYKGDLVNSGDRLETGNKSRVQIRMTDGGFLALRPNSIFQIEKYSFSRDTPEQGSLVFRFLKGGMRTLSGAIGKINRANYQMTTPMATIGIRGTDYSGVLSNDALTVTVTHGQINLANQYGNVDIPEGQTFEARANQAPTPSSTVIEPEAIESEEITENNGQPRIKPVSGAAVAVVGAEELVRPRLENYASYNQFLQAMYLFKKAEEERISPKLAVKGVPGTAPTPELTPMTIPGGTGDVTDGGETLEEAAAGATGAGMLFLADKTDDDAAKESDRFARQAMLRSNFNNFPLRAIDGSDLRQSSVDDSLNSGFNSGVTLLADKQILKMCLANDSNTNMNLRFDRANNFNFNLLQRMVATRFLGNQLQLDVDGSQLNQVEISVTYRTCQ